jgi:hypothetical protein
VLFAHYVPLRLSRMSYMVRKLALWALGFVAGLVLGTACTYAVMHRVNHRWIELQIENDGLAYSNEVFVEADIPLPKVEEPRGQAKFVDRGLGRGNELGFLIKLTVGKLDTSKLPGKYKKTEQYSQHTLGPTDTVVYDGHVEFSLKDPDGFILATPKSDTLNVWSGQENVLQGFATDSIPDALVKRTKSIVMQVNLDKCDTCRP